jgi:Tol biopolymer transport system component/DNA-binding winged helix-turn-helix (wHTH) protein
MELPVKSGKMLRFGAFEVDVSAGEIRKSGIRLRMQGQPLQILLLLLESPGQVVSRDLIREQLWASDTFVDFEHSLNTAIKKLRQTLGDDADNPRFVETLPRKGYRFIAPVTVDLKRTEREVESGQLAVTPAAARYERAAPATGPHSSRRWAWVGGIVALAGAILGYSLRRPLPTPKVLGFVKVTNDALQKCSGCGRRAGGRVPSPLLTDGSRLYFMKITESAWGGGSTLEEVSKSGGETVTAATSIPNARLCHSSPNGSELLVASFFKLPSWEAALWVAPLPGGPPRLLADAAGQDASWSPDGLRIIYAKGGDLYLARNDGSESRKLVSVPGRIWWPRVSPDGQSIRFSVMDPATGALSLSEVSSVGTQLRPLLSGWNPAPAECCGNWTADGKYFVFQSTRNGRTDLWAVRENGRFLRESDRKPMQLTTGPLNYFAPLPSRDGKRLYVVGEQPRGELLRFDVKLRQFVPFLPGLSAEHVGFSRDGGWAAYVTYPEGTLWRSKVDGSQRLQLTFPPIVSGLPRWSPDGKQIAYVGAEPGRPFRIYVVSRDGGSLQSLLSNEFEQMDPDWLDENSLVFGNLSPFSQPGTPHPAGIHVLDLKAHKVSILRGSEGLWAPRVSPDGHYVVAQSEEGSRLMLLDLTTHKTVQLASADQAGWPEWSRDSKYVFFFHWRFGERPGIFRVRISDNLVEEITSVNDIQLVGGVFGEWHGLAPDDSPLVLRDIGTQEIYALDVDFP